MRLLFLFVQISFYARYSNSDGRVFTFTSECGIKFTLPFEFASRVYYFDNQPFVGVLLKSLCEMPVHISGCEFDSSVLERSELIQVTRYPKGTPFPAVVGLPTFNNNKLGRALNIKFLPK